MGWCTAAAAAAGAGMVIDPVAPCASFLRAPVLSKSLPPLVSSVGLLAAEAGADELVGVAMSMGSPGDGADIWMVGVRIGTVRALIGSSEVSARGVLWGLSMAVAICTGNGKTVSIGPDAGWQMFS